MAANDGVQGVFSWYSEIPIVSRIYLTAAVGTTTACFLDFVSPLTLYYNYDLILRGQYWRLFSSFFFFGYFSLDFLFHLYFVVRYCRLLEEGNFRGRTPDFIFMIIFGGVLMLIFAVAIQTFSSRIRFLGHPLAFMMVYIWARTPENAGVRMSLMGLFPFNAPYLPWVLLIFSLFLGNHIENDLLGILVGHIYYFFDSVYPCVAEIRGWRQKKIIVTPFILNYIFSDNRGDNIRVSHSLQNICTDVKLVCLMSLPILHIFRFTSSNLISSNYRKTVSNISYHLSILTVS